MHLRLIGDLFVFISSLVTSNTYIYFLIISVHVLRSMALNPASTIEYEWRHQ
jgi:hypothetical protein